MIALLVCLAAVATLALSVVVALRIAMLVVDERPERFLGDPAVRRRGLLRD